MSKSYTTASGDTWDMIALRVDRPMDLMIEANPLHNYVALFNAGVILTVPAAPDPERPASLPPWLRP